VKKGLNENMRERLLFSLAVCAFFVASIILILHVNGTVGKEEENVPVHAEDEPFGNQPVPSELSEPPEPDVFILYDENDEDSDYIVINNMYFDIYVTHLDLSGMNLYSEDIVPLSRMIHLTELTIWDNRIDDISPLSGLTELVVLRIGDNPLLSDLAPLENLTELKELRLSNCSISDLTPLANLTKLEYVTLRNNQISDITPLENLKNLIDLGLDRNSITDWSPVAHVENVSGRP